MVLCYSRYLGTLSTYLVGGRRRHGLVVDLVDVELSPATCWPLFCIPTLGHKHCLLLDRLKDVSQAYCYAGTRKGLAHASFARPIEANDRYLDGTLYCIANIVTNKPPSLTEIGIDVIDD